MSQFTHVVTNELRTNGGRFGERDRVRERGVGEVCTRRLQHTVDEHEHVSSRIWEVCFAVADGEFEGSCSAIKSSEVAIATTQQTLRLRDTSRPTIIRLDSQVRWEVSIDIFQPDATSVAADCLTCDLTVRGVVGNSNVEDVTLNNREVVEVLKFTKTTRDQFIRICGCSAISSSTISGQVSDPDLVDAVVRIIDIIGDNGSPTRNLGNRTREQVNQISFLEVALKTLISQDVTNITLDNLLSMYELVEFDLLESLSGDVGDVEDLIGDRTVDDVTIDEVILQCLDIDRDATTQVTSQGTSRVFVGNDVCLSAITLVEDNLTVSECTAINVDQHTIFVSASHDCCLSAIYTFQDVSGSEGTCDIFNIDPTFILVIAREDRSLKNCTEVCTSTLNLNSFTHGEATSCSVDVDLLIEFDDLCFVVSSSNNLRRGVRSSTHNHVCETKCTADGVVNVGLTISCGSTSNTCAYGNTQLLCTSQSGIQCETTESSIMTNLCGDLEL